MFFDIISYWMLPIISGVIWLGMLLAMLLYWAVHQNGVHLVDMDDTQDIAYISDVGALTLKPLFIAGSAVTVVFLDLSFVADRWLRHNGRLLPNVRLLEKIVLGLNLACAIAGSAGLICLSIFDTYRHPNVHSACLYVFIIGFIASAVFACIEYHFLHRSFADKRSLHASFYIKLMFIIVEIALAIAFGALAAQSKWNGAAICEWILAFIFSFYVFSYVVDLWPAVHTKDHSRRHHKHRPHSFYTGSDGSTDVQAMEEARVPGRPRLTHLQNF